MTQRTYYDDGTPAWSWWGRPPVDAEPEVPDTDVHTIAHGYNLADLDRLAHIAAQRSFGGYGTHGELFDAAYFAIAEALLLAPERPHFRDLLREGSRAAADRTRDEVHHHGWSTKKKQTSRSFYVFWLWAASQGASPEGRIVERTALWQIWPQLTDRHRETLLALASTGSRQKAAELLGRPEEELAEMGPTLYGRRHGRHFRVACCATRLRAAERDHAEEHNPQCEHGRRRMIERVNERISGSRPWEHQRNGVLMGDPTAETVGANSSRAGRESAPVPDYGARSNGDTTFHVGPTADQTDDLIAAFETQHAATRARASTTTRTRTRPAIPARLRIGHMAYTVTVSDTQMDKVSQEEDATLAGCSEHHRQLIVLREDNPPDYQAETLLHEVLHQCLRVSGVDPDADAKAGCADVEERTVSSMSGPLLAVLRDNPALVAYLTADTD